MKINDVLFNNPDLNDVTGGMTPGEIGGALVNSNARLFDYQERLTVFGNSISAQVNNFATWLCRTSGQSVTYLFNAGIGGNKTSDMLARLSDIPDGTTICTVMEGANDAAAGVSVEVHAANMKAILEYIISRGITPVMVLSPMRGNVLYTEVVEQYNLADWITASSLGVRCYSIWDDMADVTNGEWLSQYSDDDVHPNSLGAKTAGLAFWEYYSANTYALPMTRNNTTGIVPNSCLLTDTNGDGEPDGFNINVASSALGATSLGLGNTHTMSYTGTGTMFLNTDDIPVIAGHEYILTMRYSATLNTGNPKIQLRLQHDTNNRFLIINDITESIPAHTVAFRFTATDGFSIVRLISSVTAVGGASYDADIAMAQVQMFDLTASTY